MTGHPSGRSSWVKVSLVLDGVPLEGWVVTGYLQKIRYVKSCFHSEVEFI